MADKKHFKTLSHKNSCRNPQPYSKNTRTLILIFFPIAAFIIMQWSAGGLDADVPVPSAIINCALMEAAFWLLFFFFKKSSRAAGVLVAAGETFSCVCGCLSAFRGNPLTPSDFLAIGTAAGVMQRYMYDIPGIGFVISGIAASIILFVFVKKKAQARPEEIIPGRKARAGIVCVSFAAAASCVISTFTPLWFTSYSYDKASQGSKNGFFLSFIHDIPSLYYAKPDGYDKEEEKTILASYEEGTNTADIPAEDCPDIVVIMDEAFSDLGTASSRIRDTDYISFVREVLAGGPDNTISGFIDVSVIGGGTANTEWEFLSGNSMAGMDAYSIVYLQYITGKTDLSYTIPSVLRSYGYETTAMHP